MCDFRSNLAIIMSHVNLLFSNHLAISDPSQHPILIVGQTKNLAKLSYDVVKVKLEPRVSEEVSEISHKFLQIIEVNNYNVLIHASW